MVSLIGLQLCDGSCNTVITQDALLPVNFPCGEMFNLTFYVTPLDSSCSSVLGYNWLKQYNLLIDWSSGHITFHSIDHRGQAPLMSPPVVAASLPQTPPLVNTPLDSGFVPPSETFPNSTPTPVPETCSTCPHISMINAAAYMHASKLPSSVTFQLQIAPNGTISRATSETLIDLSAIPEDYHEFTDVFNKGKADALPPYQDYNLKIDLERGAPPSNHMYSLSPSELETLWEFIEEHVKLVSFDLPNHCTVMITKSV